MTSEELIADLEYELDGGVLDAYNEAPHQMEFARLGRAMRRTQQWLHGWKARYKAALRLPPGEINEPQGRVPAQPQQPARPPVVQPRPGTNGTSHANGTNGTANHTLQKAK